MPPSTKSFLAESEVSNNVPLGVFNALKAGNSTYKVFNGFLIEESGDVKAYAHHTPPHALCLANCERQYLEPLVLGIKDSKHSFGSLQGPKAIVEKFLDLWPELNNLISRTDKQGCFTLDAVKPPPSTGAIFGNARVEHIPLITQWHHNFCNDTGIPNSSDSEIKHWAETSLKGKNLYFLFKNNIPVSTIKAGRVLETGRSVGFVYTPPEQRGLGYGSEITAKLSQKLLDEGNSYICLFTQLSNPTSNKIYQNIGYKWCEDFSHVYF